MLSKAQIAKELGISAGRVSQLIKAGLPVRADGKVNRDTALAWYQSNVRQQSKPGPRQTKCAPTAGIPPPGMGQTLEGEPADAPRGLGEQRAAPPPDEDYSQARVRRERAEADLSEMAAAKMRGEFAELSEVKHMLGGLVAAAKGRLLAIGNKLAPELAIESNPALIRAKIDAEVYDALSELSHAAPSAA